MANRLSEVTRTNFIITNKKLLHLMVISQLKLKFLKLFQVFHNTLALQLGLLSCVCLFVSIPCCFILIRFFSSIPNLKKNILTHLEELLVMNLTFIVCCQCSVAIFSLVQACRNDYLYLLFYIVLYGAVAMVFGIGVALSFFRVFIIISVSSS